MDGSLSVIGSTPLALILGGRVRVRVQLKVDCRHVAGNVLYNRLGSGFRMVGSGRGGLRGFGVYGLLRYILRTCRHWKLID